MLRALLGFLDRINRIYRISPSGYISSLLCFFRQQYFSVISPIPCVFAPLREKIPKPILSILLILSKKPSNAEPNPVKSCFVGA